MKKFTVRLKGVLADGTFANNKQGKKVVAFVNPARTIVIKRVYGTRSWTDAGVAEITTKKRVYYLYSKIDKQIYIGTLLGFYVEADIRKVVAHLHYWA